jgi:hypothetical protein
MGEFAEIDIEVFREEVLPTTGVSAVSTGVAPQTSSAIYVRADSARGSPHGSIHLDWSFAGLAAYACTLPDRGLFPKLLVVII